MRNDSDDDNINITDTYDNFLTVVVVYRITYTDCETITTSGTGSRLDGNDLLIVTNAHVVAGRQEMFLTVNYQQMWSQLIGRVVYVEQHRDLALVQIDDDTSDVFRPRPLAERPAQFGEPVATYGHSETEFTAMAGCVMIPGCRLVDFMDDYNIPLLVPDCNNQLILIHSAVSVPGYSGGPLMDRRSSILAVNIAYSPWLYYFSQPAEQTAEFIERGRNYLRGLIALQQHQQQQQQRDSRVLEPVLKLGLIISLNDNNRLHIVDTIDANNLTEIINREIVSINGQPVSDQISQITDTINSCKSGDNISVKLRDNADQETDQSIVVRNFMPNELPNIF
ncbi:uncharacterized protein LOC128956395 [Oppia nitens]|uniref:uncharacterized protein LOC128956395 n=1 Tax=Oppia nitens TaxID=1686743 RepID=UPI0023DBDDDD|nr:uncharacterized protein LOC128956395 [Oppia nitens]